MSGGKVKVGPVVGGKTGKGKVPKSAITSSKVVGKDLGTKKSK